jgi:hypothetical protein
MMFQEAEGVRKATIKAAIHAALADSKISFFDIHNKLQQNYGDTVNIIENPMYLKRVLRDSYNDKYEKVITAIKKNLSEDADHISIECFLEDLSK